MKRKMQITILLVCTEVKVCSILPCAHGQKSHPGHHGNKIIKPTLEFLALDDEQQRQKVSAQRERKKKGVACKTSVKESEAASTKHAQALSYFPRRQKPENFGKKFLPKQEGNIRSFPQCKTLRITPVPGRCVNSLSERLLWGLLAFPSVSVLQVKPNFLPPLFSPLQFLFSSSLPQICPAAV